ncbi:uncharacterized protein V1516DRAFT_621866 [Lipomyces oligophaga]|uniref:uncharacterized protein n=1 Tax=Lipomyces oligophaga TaxID=45792 RepID=UPI0034CF3F60
MLSYHASLIKLRNPPDSSLGRNARDSSSGDILETQSKLDPFYILPAEIIEDIMKYIPYPNSLSLKLVSKSWYSFVWDFVHHNSAAWIYFDFTQQSPERITPEYLAACLERSEGKVQEILLPLNEVRDQYASVLRALMLCQHIPSLEFINSFHMEGVPYAGSQAIWGFDPSYLIKQAAPFLVNITSLQLDDGFGDILTDISRLEGSGLEMFQKLKELRFSIRILPKFFELVGKMPIAVKFPNLEVLECLVSSPLARKELQVWPDMSSVNSVEEFIAFPKVRICRLGAIPLKIEDVCVMDQQCLDLAIRWMPLLEIFSCQGITVLGRGHYSYLHRHVYLRNCPNLEEFDFSYSSAATMPILPDSVHKLYLRGSSVVPRRFTYDSSGKPKNFVDEVSGIDEYDHKLLETIATQRKLGFFEYENLVRLDLSGYRARLSNAHVIGVIARCTSKLQDLFLDGCQRLRYDESEPNWVHADNSKTLVDDIIQLSNDIRILSVGRNDSVTDVVMNKLVQGLPKLQYLLVNDTAITDRGVYEIAQYMNSIISEQRLLKNLVVGPKLQLSQATLSALADAEISVDDSDNLLVQMPMYCRK